LELQGITDKALSVITECGYGKEHLFITDEFMSEPFAFYEEEGYRVDNSLREIITDFYMINVGKRGVLSDGVFTPTKNAFLENTFTVCPENIYDAYPLFEKLGNAVEDKIVPLGLINDDYIAYGESGRVYIIGDNVFVGGETWVDFLNNFAENNVYSPEKILN